MLQKAIFGVLLVAILGLLVVVALKQPAQNQPLGASTGPDSFFQCETHNGIGHCFTRQPLVAATSTPCVIKSPSATSSLAFATLALNVATSSNSIWTIASSTLTSATTTLGASYTILANARANIYFSPTSNGAALSQIAPGTYLTWGLAGGTGTGFLSSANVGSCQADFILN